MELTLRLCAALLPFLSAGAVVYSTFRKIFSTPAADIPEGWRWQIQGTLFAIGLSPLLLVSRTDDTSDIRLLVVASMVCLILLFPLMNAMFPEGAYYEMFRSPGTRTVQLRKLQARWRLALLAVVCFLLPAGAVAYVIIRAN